MLLFDQVEQAMTHTKRHNRNMAFMFLDLDNFKTINDTKGHDAGDMLLIGLAERLKNCVREDDIVVRLAGDEFILILTDIANPEDIHTLVGKILDGFHEPFIVDENTPINITTSIGISVFPEDGDNADSLIKYADMAMYKAKKKGKNTYAFFSGDGL